MEDILRGYRQYESERTPERLHQMQSLEKVQAPRAILIACCDSRVLPSRIFHQHPGDLFIYRNIGNLVPVYDPHNTTPSDETGAVLDFAVGQLKVRHVIICGHSNCGAMQAALAGKASPATSLGSWLRHAEPSLASWRAKHPGPTTEASADELSKLNVVTQLERLRSYPALQAVASEVRYYAWWFSIPEDRLYVSPDGTGHFEPLIPASM